MKKTIAVLAAGVILLSMGARALAEEPAADHNSHASDAVTFIDGELTVLDEDGNPVGDQTSTEPDQTPEQSEQPDETSQPEESEQPEESPKPDESVAPEESPAPEAGGRQVVVRCEMPDALSEGQEFVLRAELIGYEGVDVRLEWQLDDGESGGWRGAPGENDKLEYRVVADPHTIRARWRILVTPVQ